MYHFGPLNIWFGFSIGLMLAGIILAPLLGYWALTLVVVGIVLNVYIMIYGSRALKRMEAMFDDVEVEIDAEDE